MLSFPSKKRFTLSLLVSQVLFPLLAAAPSAPAPTPAPAPDLRITGQRVIEQPGYYTVMNDFTVAKGVPILIKSENVTVDLAGHAITGNPEHPVILTEDQLGLENIRVTGGTLIGGHHGVQISVAGSNARKSARVDHLTIFNSASAAGIEIAGNDDRPALPGRADAVITDNVIRNPAGGCFFGILLAHSSSATVKNNVVTGCQRGLVLNDVENGAVEGNQFTENSYAGISLEQSRFNRIENNQLSSNGAYGIVLSGSNNVIERNLFMNSAGTGLAIQPGPSFASVGNIYGANRGNCARCYDIAEGNIDAGGNLPAAAAAPVPVVAPRRKKP
jgi:parallel beta-helix repeat protein